MTKQTMVSPRKQTNLKNTLKQGINLAKEEIFAGEGIDYQQ